MLGLIACQLQCTALPLASSNSPIYFLSLLPPITSDKESAEESARRDFGFYGDLPSYRAMLDREGLENSWDIALSGSFEEVAEGLEKYVEAGATQVVAAVYGPQESQKETISQLAKLL